MNMQTAAPAQKVIAATVGASVATILVFMLSALFDLTIPPAVELAVQTLCIAGATFVAGYLTPPATRDRVVEE